MKTRSSIAVIRCLTLLTAFLGASLFAASQPIVVRLNEPVELQLPDTEPLDLNTESFQWLKNGRAIPGATWISYTLPAEAMTESGSYQLAITGPMGRRLVSVATVAMLHPIVVSAGNFAAPGKPFSLKAQAAGAGLTYRWFADQVELPGKKTASISVIPPSLGTHIYRCEVTLGNATAVTEWLTIDVIDATPLIQNVPEPLDLMMGIPFYHLLGSSPEGTYFISGVPGLKVDPASGEITGFPTRTGRFLLRMWARNVVGDGPAEEVPVFVRAVPNDLTGTYIGTIPRYSVFNDDLGGSYEITVTRAATYSGKVVLGTRTFRMAGRFDIGFQTTLVANAVPLKDSSGFEVTADITLGKAESDYDPYSIVLLNGEQGSLWASAGYKAIRPQSTLVGRYNSAIGIWNPSDQSDTTPNGFGFATFVLTATGQVTGAGRWSDGTPFTCATIFQGSFGPVFKATHQNTGSILGLVGFDTTEDGPPTCSAIVDSLKQANAEATSYPDGWPVIDFLITGEKYVPPGPGQRVLGLPAGSPNAAFRFVGGDLQEKDELAVPLTITPTNYRLAPTDPPGLTRGFWMSLNKNTGQVSGGFSSYELVNVLSVPLPPAPKITFSGLLLPRQGTGPGYFTVSRPGQPSFKTGQMRLSQF
ncbi:MAG: hypothetical protein JNM99_14640 [Verrucomicrobiaceae bacterium]|nr:hypothetical protein [Verrucomicrobiaceae bacterium]